MAPKATILIIEDEKDILELVRFNLAREGDAVTGVTTGKDALRAVHQMRTLKLPSPAVGEIGDLGRVEFAPI